MKKLNVFITFLIMSVIIVSCSKEATNDNDVMLKKSDVVYGPSTPVSDNGVVPEIIPGENIGGNRTCAEVAAAWDLDPNPFYCGDKINYGDYDLDGDYEFDEAFPNGLKVTMSGNFVSFETDGCILLEGKYYKVGAVIIKGSNAANVYYYPEGTTYDSGLAAPGGKKMVSNITFCFIECDQAPLVIAIKCFYSEEGINKFGVSKGINHFTTGWCSEWFLGVNPYPFTSPILLNQAGLFDTIIGEASIVNGSVTITLYENRMFQYAYVFIGTEEDLLNTNLDANGCPIYTNTPPWLMITN